jgi:L-iditol 2-dehydrogenase
MNALMKTLVYRGIGSLALEEWPVPEGDFIVKVSGCGICGTDLKTYQQGHHYFTPPTVLGHEFYGQVVRAPSGSGFEEGDFLTAAPYFECGACESCLNGMPQLCGNKSYIQGAFCEYLAIPPGYEKGLFKINAADPGVFVLTEPLACVLNGIAHIRIRKNSRVLVVGGGPMGLLFLLYFQDRGIPAAVVELNPERSRRIKEWGIPCIAPGEVEPNSFDALVLAVNKAELIRDYIKQVRNGGTVLLFAGLKKGETINVDAEAVHYRDVAITGCSGFALEHFREAFGILSGSGEHYGKLITHRLPLERGTEGFSLLAGGKAFKVVLNP